MQMPEWFTESTPRALAEHVEGLPLERIQLGREMLAIHRRQLRLTAASIASTTLAIAITSASPLAAAFALVSAGCALALLSYLQRLNGECWPPGPTQQINQLAGENINQTMKFCQQQITIPLMTQVTSSLEIVLWIARFSWTSRSKVGYGTAIEVSQKCREIDSVWRYLAFHSLAGMPIAAVALHLLLAQDAQAGAKALAMAMPLICLILTLMPVLVAGVAIMIIHALSSGSGRRKSERTEKKKLLWSRIMPAPTQGS